MSPTAKLRRSRSGRSAAKSAQATIPFLEWYENKIFRVTEDTYSLVCSFDNAGYLSKTESEQERKYRSYRSILCSLPAYIHYQEVIYNRPVDATAYLDAVASKKPPYANAYEEAFFSVQRRLVGGVDRNHSIRRYLLVLSVTVRGSESPYNRLHESYVMVSEKFREIGSALTALAPEEVFAELYHAYTPFGGNMPPIGADIYRKGLTVQDHIAPDGISFEFDHVRLGTAYARTLVIRSYGNTATDRILYALSATDLPIYIAKHIDHVDKNSAVQQIKKRLNEAEGRKATREEKKMYIPVDLSRSIQGCNELLDAFAGGEEFLRQTLYVTVYATSREQLNHYSDRMKSAALEQGATLGVVTVQTAVAFQSILPLGKDYCTLHQFLLAGESAVMTPFSYESIFDRNGFYYGDNHYSGEPIIRDRKADKSCHGFVFGNTGSGKGMWVKNEIGNILFQPFCGQDEIIVLDPSGEYIPIARAVGGRVVEFSANGDTHINPLHISEKRRGSERVQEYITAKVRGIIALLAELKGGGGLNGIETAVIDRAALRALERKDATLQTLYDEIATNEDPAADGILTWLRRYTEGSVTLFSGQDTTEEDTDTKMTVYALHKLPSDIRDAIMLTLLDKIDDRLLYNQQRGVWTWIYIDEMHRYYNADRNPFAAERFNRLYAEARKYGGILTGITQLPRSVIDSPDGSAMLSNSRFVVMSELDDSNIGAVADAYDLNEEQRRILHSAEIGQYVLRTSGSPMAVRLLLPGAKSADKNALFDLYNTSFGGT